MESGGDGEEASGDGEAVSSSIGRLKAAAPLQSFALDHLALKPYGKDLLGLCPFHKEKTPSFRVHETYAHCFGCGWNGDVIDLYAGINGISKGRAIHALAERYGVSLEGERRTRTQRVYDAQEREFVNWWWKRQCERLAVRLTAYVRLGDGPETEEAGELWRQTAALKGEDRWRFVQACAGREGREEWEYEEGLGWLMAAQ